MRAATLLILCLTLTGCNQHLVGTTYRTQVGRSVTELFHDGSTSWQVGAEFRFDVRR
jgi:hypothetical protein